jgi:O-antigen/teichoic acid export membrane protein
VTTEHVVVGRARRWRPNRATYAVTDQFVSSGSNFLVSVAVGRFGGPSELGGFAVALFVWLALIGINRAVLTEPLIIVEPALDTRANLRRALAAQLAVGLVLGTVVAAVGVVLLAVDASGIGGPLVALGVVLPMLLTQDLWRALSFGVHRPERALANDLVFTGVQVALMAGLIVTGFTSSPWFVMAWGGGAAAGVVVGMVQFHARPAMRPQIELLRELWPMSRWLLRDFATLFGAREAYLLIVAAFVTGSEFGGLRAAESLVGPAYVILLSGGNVGLPGATRTYREHGCAGLARYSRRISLVVGGAQWVYSGLLAIFGPWLMVTMYGAEFEPYTYLVWFAAARCAIAVIPFGPSIAIKVAGLAREMFHARLWVTIISLPTAVVVSAVYGLDGAAWASLGLAALLVIAMYRVYLPGVVRAGRTEPAFAPPDPGLRHTDEQLGTPSRG